MPRQRPGTSEQAVRTPELLLTAVKRKLCIQAFAMDLAASAENSVAPSFFSEQDNALVQAWPRAGWSWLNPPFSKLEPWVKKAYEESLLGTQTAMLVPAGVGANWFRNWVHGYGYVLLLNGRVTFVGHSKPYPKDLVLILYTPYGANGNDIWDWRREPERC